MHKISTLDLSLGVHGTGSLGCLVVEYFSGDKRFRKSVTEDGGGVLSCAEHHGFHISWCEELI